MLPVWASHYNEIEALQHAWQAEYEKRASGGAVAISGFHYQFLVALHDTLRAWLARPPFERTRPTVFTECLSDILDRSSNDIVLVTQVKRTSRHDSFRDALTELWLIYSLALNAAPNLVPHLRFRILSRKTELQGFERTLNKWVPAEECPPLTHLEVFRQKVTVQLFSDPEDEILGILANNLRAPDPVGYVHRWLGKLLGAAGKEGTVGFENAAQSIWNDLLSLENSSQATPPSIYVWTSQDKAPDSILGGSVLTGERPRVHHLRQGFFASRPAVYQPIADEAQTWIADLNDDQDKQLRLPVFWVGGRSGSGKSVALMHVLALLYESGFGPILWLGNKTELLRQAILWALKLGVKNRRVIIGIDDPYAPNTQNDDIIWRESLAVLENVRQDGDASALPLIMCCGPTEQAERMQNDLTEEVNVSLRELPKEEQHDIYELRSWYVQRTQKAPPQVGDENVLLVQLFFEWETGQPLPEFASRFRNRIRESDENGVLEELITRMLCANRLYVGYPTAAVGKHLTPSLQDTFRRLREEHHISQNTSDYGIGLWLAHPHLSNVIYESWYPFGNNRAVRASHLSQVINDGLELGTSASEKNAPLWAISNSVSQFKEQSPFPLVGRLHQETVSEVLPSVYKSRTQDSKGRLTLAELPVWIQLQATFPELVLTPNPVSEALVQIRADHLGETGFKLTCHKLLQHYNSLSEYYQSKIIEAIIQLLTQVPKWREWASIAEHAYRKTRHPRFVKLIVNWIKEHPRMDRADYLFVLVFNSNSADLQILNAAQTLLPRVGGEVGWGDIAIRISETSESEIPLPVFQWLENNYQQWGVCFLLGRLLRRGFISVTEWAMAWCRRWHTESSANYVLEPLLTLVGPDDELRDWCLRWIATANQNADTGFIVEKMINTFSSDSEVLSMGVRWLESNGIEHRSWWYVWSTLYIASTDTQFTHENPAYNVTQRLSEMASGNPSAWHYLFIAYSKSGRHEDGIAALKKATELDPTYFVAWQALGAVYNQLGRTEEAVRATLKLTELRPEETEVWYYLSIAYSKSGRHEDRIAALKKATELDPTNAGAWQALGAICHQLGRTEEAVRANLKLTELRPKDAEAWNYLAMAYNQGGHYTDEIAALRKATEVNPHFTQAWQALRSIYDRRGQYDIALEAQNKLIELKPDDAVEFHRLGILYYKLRRFEDAAEALKKALMLRPDITEAHLMLSNMPAIIEALEHPRTEPEGLNTSESKTFYSLARTYVETGNLPEAISALRHAIKASTDKTTATSTVIQSLLREATAAFYSESYDRAINLLNTILVIDSNIAAAWHFLSSAYRRIGKDVEAVEAAKHWTYVDPTSADAWYKLGKRYAKTGQISDAVQAFNHALQLNENFSIARKSLNRLLSKKH